MIFNILINRGFPGDASGKEPPANAGDIRDLGSIPGFPRGGHGNLSSIFAQRIPRTEEHGGL